MSAKQISQSTLVLDIAPGIIRGAFVGYPRSGSPVVLLEKTKTFVFNERMPSALRELLHEVLLAIPNIPVEYSREVEHVLISLSKPWSKTDTRAVSKIEEELVKVLGFKRGVALENSMEVYVRGASQLYDISGALLARVLEDSIELRIIERGRRDEYLRVPFGHKDVRMSVARELNIPGELVDSYLSLALKDLLHDDMRRKLGKALENAEREWYRVMRDVKHLPSHILLVSDERDVNIFAAYFKGLIRGAKVTMQDSTTLLAAYSKNLL